MADQNDRPAQPGATPPAASATDDWAEALAEQARTVPPTQADGLRTAAEAAAEPAPAAAATAASTAQPATSVFKPLISNEGAASTTDIDLIMDVPVQLTVELGRTRLTIKNLLQLGQGSIVELDALAGEPMDIFVNGYLIAQGEVVVVEDKYGIRLTDIITPSERLNRLNNRR
ncbi:MAG TPA: flagellar motor switch protein FliN [Bordetella sp.]